MQEKTENIDNVLMTFDEKASHRLIEPSYQQM